MESFESPDLVEATLARVRALTPVAPRQWGRMSAGQMLCHLDDSYRSVMGERASRDVSTLLRRTVVKFVALRTPLPWPKGVPTMEEVDAERGGTPPTEFADDRARLERSLRDFVTAALAGRCTRHPLFGAMSERDWLRWGYLHADHHLRQFGA